MVIDLICFTAASAAQLVDALRPARPLLVHCGTIWVHGPARRVPVTEDEPRTGYGEYGAGKAEIEALLHRETLAGGVPSVVLHPGHISGPGWPVINPAGNLDPGGLDGAGHRRSRWPCPTTGSACCTTCTPTTWRRRSSWRWPGPAAIGGSFHVVAEQAMTLRGLAAGAAAWFGREPVLDFVGWPSSSSRAGAEHAEATWDHTFRSITASIARAREVLGYAPRFSTPRPCTRHWPGWSRTARPMSAARTSRFPGPSALPTRMKLGASWPVVAADVRAEALVPAGGQGGGLG